MWEHIKDSVSSLSIGIVTFVLGFLNNAFAHLPMIHEILGTLSMFLGCIACAIVIVVNYRQARINGMIERDLEDKHGKL